MDTNPHSTTQKTLFFVGDSGVIKVVLLVIEFGFSIGFLFGFFLQFGCDYGFCNLLICFQLGFDCQNSVFFQFLLKGPSIFFNFFKIVKFFWVTNKSNDNVTNGRKLKSQKKFFLMFKLDSFIYLRDITVNFLVVFTHSNTFISKKCHRKQCSPNN